MQNVPGGLAEVKTLHNAATAAADGAALICDSPQTGAKTIAIFEISGISGDTITFKGRATPSGSYVAVQCVNLADGSESTTATADGIYRITCIGLYDMLADITTYSAGTITVTGKACA